MHKCDFCGKEQTEVKRMIAGKTADICDKCIMLCMEILLEEVSQGFKEINFDKDNEEREEK